MTWSTNAGCKDIPIPCWSLLQRKYRKGNDNFAYDSFMKRKNSADFTSRDSKLAWDLDRKGFRTVYDFLLEPKKSKKDSMLEADAAPKLEANAARVTSRLPKSKSGYGYESSKFAAHSGGYSYSARLKNIFLAGTIPVELIPIARPFREYWESLVQPDVHFFDIIRSSPTLLKIEDAQPPTSGQDYFNRNPISPSVVDNQFQSDVWAKLDKIMNSSEDHLVEMAKAGSSRVAELLHPEQVLRYMELVLQGYHQRQAFTPSTDRLQEVPFVPITEETMTKYERQHNVDNVDFQFSSSLLQLSDNEMFHAEAGGEHWYSDISKYVPAVQGQAQNQ
jgi:hypothetical protein